MYCQQIFILLSCTFNFVYNAQSFGLFDLALKLKTGGHLIHATLTDLNTNNKYFLEEYIDTGSSFSRGKISVSSTSDKVGSFDVYYSTKTSAVQRLVISDNQCALITYKNAKWSATIDGITSTLTTNLVLLGPSLLYRLGQSSVTWVQDADATVRGITVNAVRATLSDYTKITLYYKKSLTLEEGIADPMQMLVSNTDNVYSYNSYNKVVIDFYLQSTLDGAEKIVTPQPGIGCASYLTDGLDMQYSSVPLVGTDSKLHYITVENVRGSMQTSTRSQYFADEHNSLLYLETTTNGVTTSQIYDYTLGVVYGWTDYGCSYTRIEADSPGVSITGKFTLAQLFGTNLVFRYVGQTYFENRSGFQVHVWESIGTTYNGKTYDKVVTTLYFVKSTGTTAKYAYVPIGATINVYNKISSGGYVLVEDVDKVYYEFGLMDEAEQLRSRFQVSDCYPDSDQQITLKLNFSCDTDACDYFSSKKSYDLREDVQNALLDTKIIAPSRISNIDLVFDNNDTIAYVTFLDVPLAKNVFKPEIMYLADSSFKSATVTSSLVTDACLNANAYVTESFEALAFCGETSTCARIKSYSSLVEDKVNGTRCNVYRFPLKNFYRFSSETPLNQLQQQLSRKTIRFQYYTFLQGFNLIFAEYKVTSVIEVEQQEDEIEQLYEEKRSGMNLIEDGENVLMVENVANFGDCYRACKNSDDDSCETLAFCSYPDRVQCLVSTANYVNISTDQMVNDASCKIYSTNHIKDYVKLAFRQFKSSYLVKAQGLMSTSKCAAFCYTSDDCKSFQFCAGSCSFGETYTDSITQNSTYCHIYIPKVSQKYAVTGKKILTETFHTEINLSLDQCAALCHEWSYTEEDCVSFNYCPATKSASSCSLSAYSVKNLTASSTESNLCQNYQLVESQSSKTATSQANRQAAANGTSGGAAFGIIMLFLAGGLVIGFAAPFVYNKTQRMLNTARSSSNHDTFLWNRHLDEKDDDQQTDI